MNTSKYNTYNSKCNSNCECNCGCKPNPKPTPNPVIKPIKDCCCTKSIRQALLAIQSTVAEMNIPGFSINIVITASTGLQYPIFISSSTANPVIIGDDTITYDKTAISLCTISKIDVLTSQVANTDFADRLLLKLKGITTYCSELAMTIEDPKCSYPTRRYQTSSCSSNPQCESDDTDCCCTPGVQEYLYENQADVSSISYEGSLQKVQSIPANVTITNTTVVNDIITTYTTIPVLNNVTPNVVNTTIVNSVDTIPTSVVTNITTVPVNLVGSVAYTTTLVSAPIAVTPTTVVTSITRNTPAGSLVTGIGSTNNDFVNTITTVPTTVISDYPNFVTASGAIAGLTTVAGVNTVAVPVPSITANPGQLYVLVGSITVPVIDSTGNPVIIGAPIVANAPSVATKLVGGLTSDPTLVDVFLDFGTPTTQTVLSNVTSTTAGAAVSVFASTITNDYFNTITTSIVNVVSTAPASISVVNSITTIPNTITTVGAITSSTIAQVSNVVSGSAIQSVTLTNSSTDAVNFVSSDPLFTNVLEAVSSSTVNIYTPVFEPITGTIETLGGGIMVVTLVNGDMSILSLCEIQSVETK